MLSSPFSVLFLTKSGWHEKTFSDFLTAKDFANKIKKQEVEKIFIDVFNDKEKLVYSEKVLF